MTEPEPRFLLALARYVEGACGAAYAPRAVALLARQALEAALDRHWRRHRPALRRCSRPTQLACLSRSLERREDAERAAAAWWALSRAARPDGSVPVGEALEALLAEVEAAVEVCAPQPPGTLGALVAAYREAPSPGQAA